MVFQINGVPDLFNNEREIHVCVLVYDKSMLKREHQFFYKFFHTFDTGTL